MAYTVTFGTMTKRVNSTKQDFIHHHNQVSVNLKTPCDILAPIFTFQGDFNNGCNYFFVAEWTKYFWISSIIFREGRWEISGRLDVLATYKAAIGATNAYVERATSLPMSLKVPDPLVTASGVLLGGSDTHSMGFSAAGSYILSIAGKNGTTLWALDESSFQELYQYVFSASFCKDIADVWQSLIDAPGSVYSSLTLNLRNELLNPSQYIQDIKWIPYDVVSGRPHGRFKLGFTDGGIGWPFSAASLIHSDTFTFQIPDHPQAATLGSWLNTEYGRTASIHIPGIGTVPLALDSGSASSVVEVSIAVDCEGSIYAKVKNGLNMKLLTGSLGVSVGVSKTQSHFVSAASNLAKGAAQLYAGDMGGGLGSLANGAMSLAPTTETIAVGGSRAIVAVSPDVRLTYKYTDIIGTYDPLRVGYACRTNANLGTLTGFIKCYMASVQIAGATDQEIMQVNSFVNGGFFYE